MIGSSLVIAGLAASQRSSSNLITACWRSRIQNRVDEYSRRILQQEGISTDYSLFVVNDQSADKRSLMALETVKDVTVVEDFIPQNQQEKLFVVEDLQFMLLDSLEINKDPQERSLEKSRTRA